MENIEMFQDNEITIEKVKDLIYTVQNEFDNEMENLEIFRKEVDYETCEILSEYLKMFVSKLELIIDDELENKKEVK